MTEFKQPSPDVIYVELDGEIFVGLWNSKTRSGIYGVFPASSTSAEIESRFKSWMDGSRDDIICKFLLPESRKDEISKKWPIQGEKKFIIAVYREQAEAFFHLDTGRMRISSKKSVVEPVQEKPKRVLIVDDSKTIQTLLKQIFSADPRLEVVGVADRPSQVEGLIQSLRPDVITLDIHMPEMDGVTLLRQILPKYRVPTVMISSVSMADGNYVMSALELGAVDYVQKPTLAELDGVAPLIREKVRVAANTRVGVREIGSRILSPNSVEFPQESLTDAHLIAIGASTGGTEAIREVFKSFPEQIAPVVVVQHIPAVFSTAFAQRLNQQFPFEVLEAKDGDVLKCNRVLIAPGGFQMEVIKSGGVYRAQVRDLPAVNRHKPSVDVLFDSVVKTHGKNAVAALLTGMGTDGARGLLNLKNAGAHTVAQDEATCVVFGMPQAAIKLGAAEKVSPLGQIAATLAKFLSNQKIQKAA